MIEKTPLSIVKKGEPQGIGFFSQEASGKHYTWVAGIRAGGDRGYEDGAVLELGFLIRIDCLNVRAGFLKQLSPDR